MRQAATLAILSNVICLATSEEPGRGQAPSAKLAPIEQEGRYGYVDAAGKVVIPARFEKAKPFCSGLAAVRLGGKWGYIDKTGELVIPPQYDEASGFVNGLAYVRKGGRHVCIDRQANETATTPEAVLSALKTMAAGALGAGEHDLVLEVLNVHDCLQEDSKEHLGLLMEVAKGYRDRDEHRRAASYYQLLADRATKLAANAATAGATAAEAYYAAAECYLSLGKADKSYYLKAAKAFEQASLLFDDIEQVVEALHRSGNTYYQQKDYAAAAAVYDRTFSDLSDPDTLAVFLLNRGKCFTIMKQYEKAAQEFEKVVNRYPDSKYCSKAGRYSRFCRRKAAEKKENPK